MKTLFKRVRNFFRHPWFRFMDSLEVHLRNQWLIVERNDFFHHATVSKSYRNEIPITATIRYTSDYFSWSLSYAHDYSFNRYYGYYFKSGLELICIRLTDKIELEKQEFHRNEYKHIDFEDLAVVICESLIQASSLVSELIPKLQPYETERIGFERSVQDAELCLKQFDQRTRLKIESLVENSVK